MIVPGQADTWVEFDPSTGLEHLRSLVSGLTSGRDGVLLTGAMGRTSHMADLLRKAGIPARRKIAE